MKRNSIREMHGLLRFSDLVASRPNGKLQAEVRGYGYGLRISADCRFDHVVGHGGVCQALDRTWPGCPNTGSACSPWRI